MLHIDDKHRPIPTASLLYKCEECGFTSESINGLLVLKTSTHMRAVNKCNLCEFEAMDSIEMKEHIETSHCSSLTLYMLTTLKELTTVVSKLSEDILQLKSDSIIINNDMMSVIRGDIVEEVTDHVTSKFDILDRRVDRIHERLGEINLKETNIKEPTKPTKETGTNNRAEVTNQTNQDTYAKKAQGKRDEIKDAEKEDIKEPIKVLIVATSITNNLDRRVCE